MCDPTVIAVASTVAGIAGTAADYLGQQDAARKQEDAYNQWSQQQSRNRAQAQLKDEQDRQKAEAARVQGLQGVSATSQKQEQSAEQARLAGYLQGQGPAAQSSENPTPVSIADTRLSGQQTGGTQFQQDLSNKLDAASRDAQQRIAALATVGSYGGSSGGLDIQNQNAFATAGQGIDLANEFRRGDLSAYGIQQAVNPLQYSYTKSPFAGLASSALNFGTQGLGQMFASRIT